MSQLHTILEVRNELDKLKNSVDEGLTKECTNYIPIRLVTLIEQFFRIMIKTNRLESKKNESCDRFPQSEISISTLNELFKQYNNQKPFEDQDYSEDIRIYCSNDTNSNNYPKYNKNKNSIKFKNIKQIDCLVKDVLGEENKNLSDWIYVHTQTFQSVQSIESYSKIFTGNVRKEYICLFDTRHNLVHTLGERSFDKYGYFDLVQDLFNDVEDKHPERK